ncbi:MAG TPA: hypothetical protein VFE63_08535 [Roseiarcus sp.]|nr:hypothetical protein [Roseiarcus sp.]
MRRKWTNLSVYVIAIALRSALAIYAVAWANLEEASPSEFNSDVFEMTGCNASTYDQLPNHPSLFIGRQFFKSNGAAFAKEEGCGPLVEEETKRRGLVLDRLDWTQRRFSIIKPLLVPPLRIGGGPIEGAIVKAAYDPDAALFHGEYWVAFECVIANGRAFGIEGTSACLAPFDDVKQELRLDQVYVVVSGRREAGGVTYSASVPTLFSDNDHLYLYWSAITSTKASVGREFLRVGVRGVELLPDERGFLWAKGAGRMIYSIDPQTVEVWGPQSGDPMSDTTVGVRAVWRTSSGKIVALAGIGGAGCAKPRGPQPGCFRLAMAEADQPLGDHIFKVLPADEESLPTNPENYTRPVKTPNGDFVFLGHFFKPAVNGFSETHPVPEKWDHLRGAEVVAFPFSDKALWPSD